jgi:hypothetical protein
VDNLSAAIDELNRQIQAMHDFTDSVRGAYDEANSIKSQLDRAVSALGQGGSTTYQNGQFTVMTMSDWAVSLSEDYYKCEDFKFLSNLDSKGMNETEKAEYKKDVSNQMIWLQENGWTDKGIEAYVKYLNKEYQNYNSFGPKFDFLPTDSQLQDSYAFGAGKLVIQNIYAFLGTVKTCRVSEVSYRGAVNENIWTVTAPDGSQMTSAFLGYVGGYIPNLHYSQSSHTVLMVDNAYAQNTTAPYFVDGVLSNLNLPQPLYFLQNNFGSQLTSEQKVAIALMHTLTLGKDALEDAGNPDRQQYLAGDLMQDGVTQVLPIVVGEVGDVRKAAELTRGLESVNSVNNKMINYLLALNHPTGGSKANWSRQALGYDYSNWEELADQVKFNPNTAIETTLTEHGQKYKQIINIIGANEKEIEVQFNWIKNEDGVVRLVGAIPTKK